MSFPEQLLVSSNTPMDLQAVLLAGLLQPCGLGSPPWEAEQCPASWAIPTG